jgi:hypothetical protein
VVVAQLVRASDCGSEGRGFEPHLPPIKKPELKDSGFFIFTMLGEACCFAQRGELKCLVLILFNNSYEVIG